MSEPDWSESKTGDCEIWKNPLIPMDERLLIADGAIRFRNEQIAKLKEQNALLTVQVQNVYAALELLHDHARLYLGAYHEGQNVFDSSMDALTTLAALPQQVKSEDARPLRAFAQDIMRCWPDGDVDGGYLQDAAEKHGLIAPETRHESCDNEFGAGCNCAGCYSRDEWEAGVTCYRKTPLLNGPSDAALSAQD